MQNKYHKEMKKRREENFCGFVVAIFESKTEEEKGCNNYLHLPWCMRERLFFVVHNNASNVILGVALPKARS